MNIEKQIRYWIETAEADLDTASLLIENKKFLNGLFFCHLSIEKALKAHYTKANSSVPPKTHNLEYLVDKAKLDISKEDGEFMGLIMHYQLEGRYSQHYPQIPPEPLVTKYYEETKRIVLWLKKKL